MKSPEEFTPAIEACLQNFLHIVDHMMTNKVAPRAITLDDAVKAKLVFDIYIKVKAQRWYMAELAKRGGKPDLP